MSTERYWSYDLYNTETETVEATEQKTADQVRDLNAALRRNGEPQRWVGTPWVNH